MPTNRLSWRSLNQGTIEEDGFRIYRDTVTFDENSLPIALADVSGTAEMYDDTTALDNITYFYMIEVYRSGISKFSALISNAITSAPFWRLSPTSANNANFFAISEIQLRKTWNGNNIADISTSISLGIGTTVTSDTDNAFDLDQSTFWEGDIAVTDVSVGIQLPSGEDILEISITSPNSGDEDKTPTGFILQKSLDGISWIDVLTITGEAPWSAQETRIFRVSEPTVAVISLTGQSNMVGRKGPISSPEDDTDPSILMFSGSSLVLAQDPLDHSDETANTVGPGLSAAKQFKLNNPSISTVVLVPASDGGTGHLGNHWQRDDTVYKNMVQKINDAVSISKATYGTQNVFIAGFLHHQGESDLDGGDGAEASNEEMAGFRSYLVHNMRSDINDASDNTPFISGGLAPDWTIPSDLSGVNTKFDELELSIQKYGYASSTGLGSDPGDTVHFTAASARSLGQIFANEIENSVNSSVLKPIKETPSAGSQLLFDASNQPDFSPIYDFTNDAVFENKRCFIENGEIQMSDSSGIFRSLKFKRDNTPILGSSDFSIKGAFTRIAGSGSQVSGQCILGVWANHLGNKRSWAVRAGIDLTDDIVFIWSNNGSSSSILTASSAYVKGTEVEYEVRRTGSTIEIFINGSGTAAASATITGSLYDDPTDNGMGLVVGDHTTGYGLGGGSRWFGGSIRYAEIILN